MTSNVQLWVGKRNSEGTLSDLREVMVNGGYHWEVEDHGYNIGALVCKCACMFFFACYGPGGMFFLTEDSTALWQ